MKYAIAGIVALTSGAASSPVAQRLPNFLPLQLTQSAATPKPTSISPASYPPVLEPPYNPFTKPKFFPTATLDSWKTANSIPTEIIDPFAKKPDVPTWGPIFKIPIPVDGTASETSSEAASTSALAALLILTANSKEWLSSFPVPGLSPTSYAKPSTFVTELTPAAASSTPEKNFVFTNLYTTFTIPFVPDVAFAPSAASATPETYAVVPVASKESLTSQAGETLSSSTPAAASPSSSKAAEDILPIFQPQTSSSSPVESSLSNTPSPSPPSLDAIVILPANSFPPSTAFIPPPSTPFSSSPLPSSSHTSSTPAIAEITPTPIPTPSPSPIPTFSDLSPLKSTLQSLTSTLRKTISTFSAHSRKVSDKLSQLRKWSKQDFNAIAELKVIVDLQTKVLVRVNARVERLEKENGELRSRIEGIESEWDETEPKIETEDGEQRVEEDVSETSMAEKKVNGGGKSEEGSKPEESISVAVSEPAPAATGAPWAEDKADVFAAEDDTEDSDAEYSDEESQQESNIPEWTEEEPKPEEQYKEAYQSEEEHPQKQSDEEVAFESTIQDDGPGSYDGVWDGEPTGGW